MSLIDPAIAELSAPITPMTGTAIAHYNITGELGHGGMGEEYRADQRIRPNLIGCFAQELDA